MGVFFPDFTVCYNTSRLWLWERGGGRFADPAGLSCDSIPACCFLIFINVELLGVGLIPVADAQQNFLVDGVAVAFELPHEGLGSGVVDVELLGSLSTYRLTSFI